MLYPVVTPVTRTIESMWYMAVPLTVEVPPSLVNNVLLPFNSREAPILNCNLDPLGPFIEESASSVLVMLETYRGLDPTDK